MKSITTKKIIFMLLFVLYHASSATESAWRTRLQDYWGKKYFAWPSLTINRPQWSTIAKLTAAGLVLWGLTHYFAQRAQQKPSNAYVPAAQQEIVKELERHIPPELVAEIGGLQDYSLVHTLRKSHLLTPFIAAAFSPDGKTIVTINLGVPPVCLWDAHNYQFIRALGDSTGRFAAAAFSPNSAKIVTVDSGHPARVWDMQGTVLKSLGDTTRDARCVTFSPDGTMIVMLDHRKHICVYNATSGELTHTFEGNFDNISAQNAFSSDGKQLVAAQGNNACIIEFNTGNILQILTGHTAKVNSATFSHGSTYYRDKYIVTASDDKTARIWNAGNGTLWKTLGKDSAGANGSHTQAVTSAVFHPDDVIIATGSVDATVRIWDFDDGLCSQTLNAARQNAGRAHEAIVSSVAFSPDGKKIITAGRDSRVKIWQQ